jgi:hypothetical protein
MQKTLQGVLEMVTVKLFQNDNAPGPRLKPDEEYVGSLLSNVIFHNYRREKISPDDPPPMPCLKIWGVRPPAKEGDKSKGPADSPKVYSKEELIFLMRSLQLENKKIGLSLQEQRSVLNEVYEDLGTFYRSLNGSFG